MKISNNVSQKVNNAAMLAGGGNLYKNESHCLGPSKMEAYKSGIAFFNLGMSKNEIYINPQNRMFVCLHGYLELLNLFFIREISAKKVQYST